jgi:Fe-S oxidoreductase
MVMPAIHLSRYQVADLFSDVTGSKQETEIERLVKVARRELRQKFVEADMGVSGANFALADTATIGLTTNEGNARLVTTLPRIHVALVGLDKLLPTLADALHVNRVLPRNATGQAITSYVTWITGPNPCASGETGKKEMHIVFLDNGRRALAKDPVFSQVLRCVRCGACANVCPVYRMVGGHQLGHIYIGAIGLIATYFFHGRDKAKNLVQNCINCGACKAVCAAGIDLPGLIKEIHARIQDETDHPLSSVLLGKLLGNRSLFHTLLRTAQKAQAPVAKKNGFMRHLPLIFSKAHNFRALPAIAKFPFRDRWPVIKKTKKTARATGPRVALFAGCVQDFVYPEQLEAGVALMQHHGAALSFPMDQSCCGLPAMMMGEKSAAREVARRNILAMHGEKTDHIVTLCASCASHLKHNYPKLFADDPAMLNTVQRFADKVIAFSTFMNDVIKIPETTSASAGTKTTYHAPCHLCRGMGEKKAPGELIRKAGLDFVPAKEEETCCGFGGSFSGKFPQISSQILATKLADIKATGAELLVTECPGCVMQLRGGIEKSGMNIDVKHIAEAMVKRL